MVNINSSTNIEMVLIWKNSNFIKSGNIWYCQWLVILLGDVSHVEKLYAPGELHITKDKVAIYVGLLFSKLAI